ncbi:hypothetical protein scyTo_0005657, partial [Scyliorhinus torazame]|nr:hypothetical protein [Scyliorhinus torazame]
PVEWKKQRHGAFVCTQINPQSGKIAPRGEETFLLTGGSHSVEQLKEEKGNMGGNILASPKLCSMNLQQMLCSGTCLSKPDREEAAKAYTRIRAEGQNSLQSQTDEVHGGLSEQQQVALDAMSTTKQKSSSVGTAVSTPLHLKRVISQTNHSHVLVSDNTKHKLTAVST